tara:strand:+ start:381 stop:956 length:576 start_codon:yes stop_codon:yes gene_type:complete
MSKRGTCWEGYQQKGMKKKGNRMVPNCVPAGMKSGGLKEWFNEKWVDISAPKKGGGYKSCGRKSASGSKRKYPKCVPAAKANQMTSSQKRSAVVRKRSKAQGVGGKPTNVKTILKADQGTEVNMYPKGKFSLNFFQTKGTKAEKGDNLITTIRDSKAKFNPELSYDKIYKKSNVGIGVNKDRIRIGFKKVF